MLRKCSSVSIFVSDENQKAKCKTVASQIKVDVNKTGEVILCDGKNLSKISHNNYDKVVLILNNESPVTYIKEGITRFIFDFDNMYELCVAMYTDRPSATIYDNNDCYFDFNKNNFLYKGEKIFISKSQREVLKSVLINGEKKSSSYRTIVYRLRKKFGKEFLI